MPSILVHWPNIVRPAQLSLDIFLLFQLREYGLPRNTHRMRNGRRVSRCASPTSSHAPCCANQKASTASAPKPSSVVPRVIVLQRGCQNEDIYFNDRARKSNAASNADDRAKPCGRGTREWRTLWNTSTNKGLTNKSIRSLGFLLFEPSTFPQFWLKHATST